MKNNNSNKNNLYKKNKYKLMKRNNNLIWVKIKSNKSTKSNQVKMNQANKK